jgi:riboflavin kinase/FMN adenylyltransferase
MQVVRNRPDQNGAGRIVPGRSVVAIGNFDGVHRGHQALIDRCKAQQSEGESIVIVTFEPLPRAWFSPEDAEARLSTVYQKLDLFRSAGVDVTWMMRFGWRLSGLPAREFVQQVLEDALAARYVIVGEDFRFGQGRSGDVAKLSELGIEHGFTVESVPMVTHNGLRISSSEIRRQLARGNFSEAEALLGRPFRMEGHVTRGRQLGRNLGFPTANLRIRARPCPIAGIFAVFARVQEGDWMPGVANLGKRPAVGGRELLLEVYLFDFEGSLYGQRLEVHFVAKLRNEVHFYDLADLVDQMCRDADEARSITAAEPVPED